MANMDVTQRNQSERATLAGSSERIRRGSERGLRIYTLLAVPIAVLLCWGALSVIDAWWQWVVLGVILLLTYAFMTAVSPNRRGSGDASSPVGD
ncbi:MAG: hypothetical protein QOG09_850 [Solirubrobacterales bacterium]|nr:hypothetical protein [Solirubrobacterales bacterium]MDX6662748.1 hypothetical protein [Solirubrobacterales bacterium]